MAENNTVSPMEDDAGSLGSIIAEKADKIKYLVLAVLVILIAVAALVGYMRKSSAQRAAAAKDKVFETVAAIQNEATPPAEAAQLFAAAAKEYSGLDAGAQAAAMQFAYAYNENKEYAAAEQAVRDFIKTYPQSPMLRRARLALGQAMLQQDKIDDAIAVFREVTAANDPETLPEAKLALAQALERRAEQVKDNEVEYRSRLEEAEAEYTDIIARSQIPVPSQRGFWPQAVTLPADYALVQLKDRLAGHVHGTPTLPTEDPATPPTDGILSMPLPPAGSTGADAAVSAAVAAAIEAVNAARANEEAPAEPAAPVAPEVAAPAEPEEKIEEPAVPEPETPAAAPVPAAPPAAAPANAEAPAEAEEEVEEVAAPEAPAAAPTAADDAENSAEAGEAAAASTNN